MPRRDNPNDRHSGDWPRFVWLHAELARQAYPNAPGLVARFGISYKAAVGTLRRYEENLGAPLAYDDSRKGYFYANPDWAPQLPPAWLGSDDGAMALIAFRLLGDHLSGPEAGALADVLLPGAFGRLRERVTVEAIEQHPPDTELFRQVVRALTEERLLRLHYAGIFETTHDREVEPLSLHHCGGNWYLFANCRRRADIRAFAVDRIVALDVMPERFAYPSGFDAKAHATRAFGIYKSGAIRTARIRFSPHISAWIRQQRWHPEQTLIETLDGGLEMTLPIGQEGIELVREVLRFGPDAELLEPQDLREVVASRLREASLRYT